jgi:hypothetical protein
VCNNIQGLPHRYNFILKENCNSGNHLYIKNHGSIIAIGEYTFSDTIEIPNKS